MAQIINRKRFHSLTDKTLKLSNPGRGTELSYDAARDSIEFQCYISKTFLGTLYVQIV